MLLGSVLVQCGTNLTDEYADHHPGKGAEHKVQAPYKVIAQGLLTPVAVRRGALTCFGLAALIGVSRLPDELAPGAGVPRQRRCGLRVQRRATPIGEYRARRAFSVCVYGASDGAGELLVQVQRLYWTAVWLSVPVGCLVTAILVANNLRDAEEDRHSGKHTLVALWGSRPVIWLFCLLVLVAFGMLPVLALSGVVPWVGLLPFVLLLPQSWTLIRLIWRGTERAVLHQAPEHSPAPFALRPAAHTRGQPGASLVALGLTHHCLTLETPRLIVFHGKDMRIQIGDPLFPCFSAAEIAHAILDIGRHHLPEKGGIVLPQIARVFVAEHRIDARFFKFIKQGRDLPHMIRRSELPDEVQRPQEPWVIVCALVVIVVRHRKARALDIGRNDLAIDDRTVPPKALAHEALAAVHMIGRERGIARSGGTCTVWSSTPVVYTPLRSSRHTPRT